MSKLQGRVGLLTGVATGIGRMGAQVFAREGAQLVLLDINAEEGEKTRELASSQGADVVFVHGDVSKSADVKRAVRAAVDTFGKLDLVWSNAGIGVFKTVPDTEDEELDRIIEVNLKGGFLVCKHAIPEIAKAGGGTIVLTGSINSFHAAPQWAAYCATKGGVLMLAKAMAIDHAAQNIRVNCVCPGSVDTKLQEDWLRFRESGMTYEEAVRADQASHLLDRYATPEEVSKAALFLSCDDSSFTTGSALMVDGGLSS
ncbi:MAG: glucose 1-dehydrogenase [Nitrospiraceae bacterium]|nr:glucose 1-dehydrogenase [Nitrospiraceae bacterium]